MSQRIKSLLVVTTLTLACADGSAVAGDSKNGNVLFQEKCAVCHGTDGNAKLPGAPNFAKGERLEKADDKLRGAILNGLNAMPPFKGMLNDTQVGDALAFIRTLKK